MQYYQVWVSQSGLEGVITRRGQYDVLFTFAKDMDGFWRLKEHGSDKWLFQFPAREFYNHKENFERFKTALQDFFNNKESEGGFLHF